MLLFGIVFTKFGFHSLFLLDSVPFLKIIEKRLKLVKIVTNIRYSNFGLHKIGEKYKISKFHYLDLVNISVNNVYANFLLILAHRPGSRLILKFHGKPQNMPKSPKMVKNTLNRILVSL